MPRKQYRSDLLAAGAVADFGNITEVRPGADDETFTFMFRHPATDVQVQITALLEPSDYPSSHEYSMFASEDAPADLAARLADCRGISGKPIYEAMPIISAFLTRQVAVIQDSDDDFGSDTDGAMSITSGSHASEEADVMDFDNDDDEPPEIMSQTVDSQDEAASSTLMKRARADLRAVKDAGFKVGVIGGLAPGNVCYISIACRIAKLGISEEAQDAWAVDNNDYLILLLHFPHGYRALDFLRKLDDHETSSHVRLTTGLSDHYKPRSVGEAHAAFKSKGGRALANQDQKQHGNSPGFRDSFISEPLNVLLNERLLNLISLRLAGRLSWTGAQKRYTDNMLRERAKSNSPQPGAQHAWQNEGRTRALPRIVAQDHLCSVQSQQELSLPLIAMQFLLRHFVRCTEFCLVCFTKLSTDVEAIKPYVCGGPLCLYQYMSLGFGPTIEHEIVNQPYVVDMLVSFCYASARHDKLHEYPEGLEFSVPHPDLPIQGEDLGAPPGAMSTWKSSKSSAFPAALPSLEGTLHPDSLELVLNPVEKCTIRPGQWLVLNPINRPSQSWHCRVVEIGYFPTIKIAPPVILESASIRTCTAESKPSAPELPTSPSQVSVHAYDQSFQDLNKEQKRKIFMVMLDTLPPVSEMRIYLGRRVGCSLYQWTERICPASLGLLRWIIASNRSCIMQVDQLEEDTTVRKRPEGRVKGVDGYMQFRFAMGAPDKEQRFINSIRLETADKEYPTIFAWHGSPLANWHSIVRQGLNYDKVAHGRAYGDGVYHAKDFATSGGYTGVRGVPAHLVDRGPDQWSQSQLRPLTAIALSEIVNAPEKFKSQEPYYVVPQLDWIQARYLFIRLGDKQKIVAQTSDVPILRQDPCRTPSGTSGGAALGIVLPITAIPKSRRHDLIESIQSKRPNETSSIASPSPGAKTALKRDVSPTAQSSERKRSTSSTSGILKYVSVLLPKTSKDNSDDAVSIATDVEDLSILFEPEEEPLEEMQKRALPVEPVTGFKITPLDDLPLAPTPSFATSIASRRLQKDYAALLKTQQTHVEKGTLAELGWFVDPNFMLEHANLYQWIAELHSFPLSLPVAKDMQKLDIQSIILEFRFYATYPMSPPFVRVVRPRFLPFAHGGGGHVTGGGSICSELLTNTGWTAVSDIESVLLQIRVGIMNLDPAPARLLAAVHGGGRSDGPNSEYSAREAVDAYKRACNAHGWKIPDGIDATVLG